MPAVVNSGTPPQDKDEWRTDPELFNLLNSEFNFQLDAAATSENTLCNEWITKEIDALKTPWYISVINLNYPRASIFCNPPFSQVGEFLLKGREEAAKGATCVFLVRADGLETKWWKEGVLTSELGIILTPACEIRFLSPRTNFYRPDGSKASGVTFPSAVIVMGPYAAPSVFWWNWKDNLVPKL